MYRILSWTARAVASAYKNSHSKLVWNDRFHAGLRAVNRRSSSAEKAKRKQRAAYMYLFTTIERAPCRHTDCLTDWLTDLRLPTAWCETTFLCNGWHAAVRAVHRQHTLLFYYNKKVFMLIVNCKPPAFTDMKTLNLKYFKGHDFDL